MHAQVVGLGGGNLQHMDCFLLLSTSFLSRLTHYWFIDHLQSIPVYPSIIIITFSYNFHQAQYRLSSSDRSIYLRLPTYLRVHVIARSSRKQLIPTFLMLTASFLLLPEREREVPSLPDPTTGALTQLFCPSIGNSLLINHRTLLESKLVVWVSHVCNLWNKLDPCFMRNCCLFMCTYQVCLAVLLPPSFI